MNRELLQKISLAVLATLSVCFLGVVGDEFAESNTAQLIAAASVSARTQRIHPEIKAVAGGPSLPLTSAASGLIGAELPATPILLSTCVLRR